jgi:hypothetical protein
MITPLVCEALTLDNSWGTFFKDSKNNLKKEDLILFIKF